MNLDAPVVVVLLTTVANICVGCLNLYWSFRIELARRKLETSIHHAKTVEMKILADLTRNGDKRGDKIC
jgi:hypothetical protein